MDKDKLVQLVKLLEEFDNFSESFYVMDVIEDLKEKIADGVISGIWDEGHAVNIANNPLDNA